MKSYRLTSLFFILLVLGLVLGGGCLAPPPGLPNLDPACPTESDLGDPFPAMLSKGTTSTAGEAAGQFSVTSGGQPRYTIPFILPPSRGAMGPQIGLVYDGAGGDGPAGLGFSLSGFSVVARCPKNVAQDLEIRGVKLDEDDALCLDQLRIVEQSAGEFRTFPDTFRKIVVKSKKEPIRVYAKDGTTQTYEPLTSRAWWITRNEDRNGNFVVYGYRNEAGEVVPDFIEYTGHPNWLVMQWTEFS